MNFTLKIRKQKTIITKLTSFMNKINKKTMKMNKILRKAINLLREIENRKKKSILLQILLMIKIIKQMKLP